MAAYFVFHHRVVNAEKAREYLSRVGATLAPYSQELLVSAASLESNLITTVRSWATTRWTSWRMPLQRC